MTIKLKVQPRTAVKVKTIVRVSATLIGAGFISVARAGNVYTIGIDEASLSVTTAQVIGVAFTLNAGTNFGLTVPGQISMASTGTIGATTDNLRFNGLGLGIAAPTSGGQISTVLGANNITGIAVKRNTDTSPTGNFAAFTDATGTTLWGVDITGIATSTGNIVNPTAASLNRGINVTQTAHGTTSAGVTQTLNVVQINSDDVSNATGNVQGFRVSHLFGGSNASGTRSALNATLTLNSTTSASGTDTSRYYVGVQGVANAIANDNGSGGTPLGKFVGVAGSANSTSAGTHLFEMIGLQSAVVVASGSSVANRYGVLVEDESAVQGSSDDAAYALTGIVSGIGWKTGLLFTAVSGQAPMASSGTLIATSGSATVANGVDLSSYTITSNAFKSTGFTVNGSGNLAATLGTITSASASALMVGANGATNPVLQIDASTGSVATGLKIKGGATGGTTAISVIDSGSNANLAIDAKGTGGIQLGATSTGNVTVSRALVYGGVTLTNAVTGTGKMVLDTGASVSSLTVTTAFTATGLVTNADLANSSVTFGTTAVALGASSTSIAGLNSVGLTSGSTINWNSDTYHGRAGAANFMLGQADAATAVAQTVSVQNVVAGTSNTAGANFTITGSKGTGTGNGGNIALQVAPAGSTGSTQNSLVSRMTILGSTGYVGLGTETNPQTMLTVSNNVSTGLSLGFNEPNQVTFVSADSNAMAFAMVGVGSQGEMIGYRTNGSWASKTALGLNNIIFSFFAGGHNGSAFVTSAGINFIATDPSGWAVGANGTCIDINVMANGTNSSSRSMRFNQSNGVGVATNIDPGTGCFIIKPQTVASLSAAGSTTKGRLACVTDATSTTPGGTVVGGGSNTVIVKDSGAAWIILG